MRDEALKKILVWMKGREVPGFAPYLWRYDAYGFLINYLAYGDQNSPFGWHIDHYPVPKSMGGGDDISNLRPLYHGTNTMHGGLLSLAMGGK